MRYLLIMMSAEDTPIHPMHATAVIICNKLLPIFNDTTYCLHLLGHQPPLQQDSILYRAVCHLLLRVLTNSFPHFASICNCKQSRGVSTGLMCTGGTDVIGMAVSKRLKQATASGEGPRTCSIAGDIALAMLLCGMADCCASVDVSLPDHTAR